MPSIIKPDAGKLLYLALGFFALPYALKMVKR